VNLREVAVGIAEQFHQDSGEFLHILGLTEIDLQLELIDRIGAQCLQGLAVLLWLGLVTCIELMGGEVFRKHLTQSGFYYKKGIISLLGS
jgi:hypothetical protein